VGTEPLALVEGNLMTDFFLHSFNTLGNGLIGYIIPFLFVLTIVVFFHELGHFLVARWNGVKVLTFSLGFGPELAGFNDRHGTRWKISAIPLGGYVKFFGDESEASTPASSETLASMTAEERAGSFHHKKVGARAAIVAAGPIANFILAIVIFTCLFTFFGKPSTTARVDKIEANSAASKAGFQVGDIVTAIDGKTIGSFSDMQRVVGVRAGDTLNFTIKRSGTARSEGFVRKRPSSGRARYYPGDGARRCRDRAGRSRQRALAGREGDLVRGGPYARLYRRGIHRPRSR
jgi:regulator of sigma E protease